MPITAIAHGDSIPSAVVSEAVLSNPSGVLAVDAYPRNAYLHRPFEGGRPGEHVPMPYHGSGRRPPSGTLEGVNE